MVAGSGPLVLSPSQLLTDAACWQVHGGTCNVFGILLGHISFSIKITAVFQLFPSEGISFPWTEARCFLSAACTPLHHLSFPGGPWLCLCSRKGLPPALETNGLSGPEHNLGSTKKGTNHQHQCQGLHDCAHPCSAWRLNNLLHSQANMHEHQVVAAAGMFACMCALISMQV